MVDRAELHRQAAHRHHVVSRAQWLAHGVAASTGTRWLRDIGWEPFARGAWCGPTAKRDLRQEGHATDLVVPGAVFTGQFALWLRNLQSRQPDHVSVLVGADRRVRRQWSVHVHRSQKLDAVTAHRIDGLLVALPARAIADDATERSRVPPERHSGHTTGPADERHVAEVIARVAQVRRQILDEIDAELRLRRRFPGRRLLRRAYAQLTGELSHSRIEAAGRRLAQRVDPRFTTRPFAVRDAAATIGEVDTALEALRYGVEIDGPPHLLPWVAERDRRRDRQLHRAGWTIDRFFWHDVLQRPEQVAAEIRAALTRLQQRAR